METVPDYKNKSLNPITREINGILYIEEWRPTTEWPDIFYISSFGRLKRVGRKSVNLKKPDLFIPEKIIKGGITKKGYIRFNIKHKNKSKSRYAHRLAALSFIPKIDGKPDVNHITGVKTNNHTSQLEWCTPKENNEHGVNMGLLKRGRNTKPYIPHPLPKKKIKMIDINGNELKIWDSVIKAAENFNSTPNNFRKMIKKSPRNYYKGFIWKYA